MTTGFPLLIYAGNLNSGVPTSVPLTKSVTCFGRQGEVDVVLDCPVRPKSISRKHCEISYDAEKGIWEIKDCNSLNGVWVNFVKSKQCQLYDNDIISFAGLVENGEEKPSNSLKYIFSHNKEDDNEMKLVYRKDNKNVQAYNNGRHNNGTDLDRGKKRNQDEVQNNDEERMTKKLKTEHLEEKNQLTKEISDLETLLKQKQDEILQTVSKTEEEMKKTINEKDKISEELSLLKQEMEKLKNSSVAFQEELICPICCELLFDALTLSCSHTFCSGCLNPWMKTNKSCPVCRQAVRKRIKAIQVNNLVQRVVNSVTSSETERWLARKNEVEELEKLKKLREDIKRAKEKSIRFLNIRDPWTNDQIAFFKQGIRKYKGIARKVYSEATGLDSKFVGESNLDKLRNACRNIGSKPPQQATERDLRNILTAFINDGI